MAKRPGLPKKYAKYGFAKGWKLYKAAKRKRTSGPARTTATRKTTAKATSGKSQNSTVTKPTTIVIRRPSTMAAAKKTTQPKKRRMGRPLISQMDLNLMLDALMITAGTLTSLIAVNKFPWVKDQPSWMKALFQGGAGLTAMRTVKNRNMKRGAMGVLVGGGVSATMPFVPEGLRVFGRRRLSPVELNKLKTLKRPAAIPNNGATMGRPVSIPVDAAPIMGRAGNRSSRYS